MLKPLGKNYFCGTCCPRWQSVGPCVGDGTSPGQGAGSKRVVKVVADQVGRNSPFGRLLLLWKFSSDHSHATETLSRWQNRTHSRNPPGFWCFPHWQGISEQQEHWLSCLEEIPVASGDSIIWGKLGLYNNPPLPSAG